MKRDKGHILLAIIILFISIYFSSFISDTNAVKFVSFLPNILGILLGGVLASLAIIFGLLNSQELAFMYAKSLEVLEKDSYAEFINETRFDTLIIFISLCISIFIFLISVKNTVFFDIGIPPLKTNIMFDIKTMVGFELFLLILCLSATYDIITSLFELNKTRYRFAKESISQNSK